MEGFCQQLWPGCCQSQSTHLQTSLVRAKSLQSCLTVRDPMDCSLPGSSVHGILQAKILEWVAMSFSYLENRSPALAGGFFTISTT